MDTFFIFQLELFRITIVSPQGLRFPDDLTSDAKAPRHLQHVVHKEYSLWSVFF